MIKLQDLLDHLEQISSSPTAAIYAGEKLELNTMSVLIDIFKGTLAERQKLRNETGELLKSIPEINEFLTRRTSLDATGFLDAIVTNYEKS